MESQNKITGRKNKEDTKSAGGWKLFGLRMMVFADKWNYLF